MVETNGDKGSLFHRCKHLFLLRNYLWWSLGDACFSVEIHVFIWNLIRAMLFTIAPYRSGSKEPLRDGARDYNGVMLRTIGTIERQCNGDGAMPRWCDGMVVMKRCSVAESLSRQRTIVIASLRYQYFFTCAVVKKMATGLLCSLL